MNKVEKEQNKLWSRVTTAQVRVESRVFNVLVPAQVQVLYLKKTILMNKAKIEFKIRNTAVWLQTIGC